jgi:thioredoxin 1
MVRKRENKAKLSPTKEKAKGAEIKEVKDADFEQFVKGNSISFVDFFAEWCMPCVMMVPVVEELAKTFSGRVAFAKMNIDENHGTAEKFKIMSIPTMIVFKKGEIKERITGALSHDMLREKINSCL